MSKRNSGRRGRSRKRNRGATRPLDETSAVSGAAAQPASGGSGPVSAGSGPAAGGSGRASGGGGSASRATGRSASAQTGTRRRGARQPAVPRSGYRDPGGVGDRPEAPWHPWPLSELLIFVGAVGTIVAFASKAQPLLFASIGSVLLGTLDFTIREHRTGYRAHSALLAAVPTAVMHGGIALALFAAGVRGEWLVVLPLLLDVPVFWLLFRLLRARFEDARRERVFALKHR